MREVPRKWDMAAVAEDPRLRRLVYVLGLIYSVSFYKYVKRDPLSGSLGIEAVLETGSVALAFALSVMLALRGGRRRFGPMPALYFLALFGIFTAVSAFRSFSPSLSLTKSILYCAVLGMSYLLAQMGFSWEFLRGIYTGFVSILLLGLGVGVAFPSRFPLIHSEEWTERNRLSIFDTHPNTLAELCAMMFLLGWILGARRRWWAQILLVAINLLAGEKTATAALVLVSGLCFLLERKWSPLRATAIALGTGLVAVVVVLGVTDVANLIPARYAAKGAEAIYGTKTGNELQTMDGRAAVWAKGMELAENGVLVGYGIEGAREALLKAVSWSGQAHNGFLEIVLDGGCLGAALFLFGWLMLARAGMRGRREWVVRVGALHGLMLILAIIGPVWEFYSYLAEALAISLAYLALAGVQDGATLRAGIGDSSREVVWMARSATRGLARGSAR